jgi:hypothetical protein
VRGEQLKGLGLSLGLPQQVQADPVVVRLSHVLQQQR